MTETEKNHLIRWLLLAPGVLGASALALACGLGILVVLTWLADFFVISAVIVPATTAVVWIGTAYYIAPSHHIVVIWGAYIVGNVFVFIFFPLPPLWLAAAIGGISACGYYSDKFRNSKKINVKTKRKNQ